ncbi:hypothetical protein [Streptomyces sp. NBC_01451]|uniref:hypothetical protein n=1 Tax=Streptomyces sp. NBC_01451 TaxID=2903872 RepID=UPI002E32B539|nr:hypothetical protein [Streptomyces sp. NBC_01451]
MHNTMKRAAARRSVKVDMRRDVLKANGTQVRDFLETLRSHRYSMTDSAYAFAYRSVLGTRRATRQSVEDRMRSLRHPVSVGGSSGR